MLIITGAAGFIGSCLVSHFNQKGIFDLILVDKFGREDKDKNLAQKSFAQKIDRAVFLDWFAQNTAPIDLVYHLGARTDTTEKNKAIFDELNLNYSKEIAQICSQKNIPLIYASSAATYGLGQEGYDDQTAPSRLKPLNPYGDSKNNFDHWLMQQESQPPFWAGLKFFNVYGANEYHKGRMSSVILHAFRQIKKTGAMKLFKSHRSDFEHGQQSRDFIYIKDLLAIMDFLSQQKPASGLYNVGTGTARSFWDLADLTFKAMELPTQISFIDTPLDIRDTYQYYTAAKMDKLYQVGFQEKCHTLEEGIHDYVCHYLIPNAYF